MDGDRSTYEETNWWGQNHIRTEPIGGDRITYEQNKQVGTESHTNGNYPVRTHTQTHRQTHRSTYRGGAHLKMYEQLIPPNNYSDPQSSLNWHHLTYPGQKGQHKMKACRAVKYIFGHTVIITGSGYLDIEQNGLFIQYNRSGNKNSEIYFSVL